MSPPSPVSAGRPRLISPQGWLVAGLAVLLPLLWLFQSTDRWVSALRSRGPDSLSFRYLELLARMKPEDADLQLMLARRLKDIGRFEEARGILNPLLRGTGAARTDAESVALQADYLSLTAMPADDARRPAAEGNLIRRLEDFRGQGATGPALQDAARITLALNRPTLAAEFYEELADRNAGDRIRWLREASRWFTAGGNGAKAGLVLDRASSLSPDPEQSRALALEAMSALLGAMAFEPALKLAGGYLEKFSSDRSVASRAIDLALAAGRLDLAEAWAGKLASIAGNDPAVLARRLEIELWANDLPSAVATALALTALAPEDQGYRTRLAQVATWANRPELALEQRLWLVEHGVAGENLVEAERLAIGTHNDAVRLTLIERRAALGPLSEAQLADAVAVYGRGAGSGRLEAFLAGYVSRHPRARAAWLALARTREGGGKLPEALAAWERIDRDFGATPASTLAEAEDLWRLERPEAALALLRRRESAARPEDEVFWRRMAELGWELEDDGAALAAHRALWGAGKAGQVDAERLISLLVATGSAREAIATARRAAERFGEDRFLLLALQLALPEKQWEELETLLAEASKGALVDTESYWLLRAELMRHRKAGPEAAASYEQALARNPQSVAARTGLLWASIDLRRQARLAKYLKLWEAEAASDARYWTAYAAGLDALGRTRQALPWFARQAAAKPDDLLWLLSYADALTRTGCKDSAWRLRRHVLAKLGRRQGRGGKVETGRALRVVHARLLGELGSADAHARLMAQLAAETPADPAAREYLVSHYLAERQFAGARRWLLKAHEERQSLPDWQELAVALADHDEAAARRILESPHSRLDPVARVEGWKQLGDHGQALAVARQSLAMEPDGRYAEQFQREIAELNERHSDKLGLGWDYKRLGSLGINEYRATLVLPDQPAGDWTSGIEFARRHLSFSGSDLSVGQFSEEFDIRGNLTLPLLGGKLDTGLGSNIRDDDSLVQVRLGWTLPLSGGALQGKIEGAYHELPTESSYLRALGVKDFAALELLARLSARNTVRIKADLHRYETRSQEFLGRGYAVEGEIAHNLLFEQPFWQIRLQAGWMGNDLAGAVPPRLLALGLSPSVGMDMIVPREYGMVGLGNHFGLGSARGPNAALDAWTGYVWPAEEFAYNLRLSAVTPALTADDKLGIEAFYANAQSGQMGQAYRGLGVFYQLAF